MKELAMTKIKASIISGLVASVVCIFDASLASAMEDVATGKWMTRDHKVYNSVAVIPLANVVNPQVARDNHYTSLASSPTRTFDPTGLEFQLSEEDRQRITRFVAGLRMGASMFWECYDFMIEADCNFGGANLQDMTGWGWGCWGITEQDVEARFLAECRPRLRAEGFPMHVQKECNRDNCRCCLFTHPVSAHLGLVENTDICVTWGGQEVSCSSGSARCKISIAFTLNFNAWGDRGHCVNCETMEP